MGWSVLAGWMPGQHSVEWSSRHYLCTMLDMSGMRQTLRLSLTPEAGSPYGLVCFAPAEAAGAGEGAPQPSGAPKQEGLWNLAGLRPNETQVLVAPGMVPQQRQQAQRGEAPGSGGEPAVQGGADVVAVAGREGAGEQAAAAATPEASQAEGGTAAAGSSGAELAAAGSGTVSDRAAAAQPSGRAEQGGGLAGRDAPPEALAPPGSGPPMQLAASDRTVSDRQEERAGPRRPVAHADSNQTVSEHASAPLAAPLAAQQQPQRIAASDQQHSAAPSAVGSAGRAPGAEAVVERAPAAAVAEQRLEEMEGEHSMEMVGVGASADDAHMPQATGSEVESVDVESVEVDMPVRGRLRRGSMRWLQGEGRGLKAQAGEQEFCKPGWRAALRQPRERLLMGKSTSSDPAHPAGRAALKP